MPDLKPPLRVLVFNWHEPYICLFAGMPHHFEVAPPLAQAQRRWNVGFRPVPANVTEIEAPVASARARQGAYDLVLCLTLQDVQQVQSWDVPRLFVMLNMIGTDAGLQGAVKDAYVERLRPLFQQVDLAFISEKKRRDWGWPAPVVVSGIEPQDYGGYTGEVARVLRVGNRLRERDAMQGFSLQEQIVAAGLPSTVVGDNPTVPGARPASSWEELKSFYRSHRVLLCTLADEHEDGYNLAVLEAMATGMPVVTTPNSSSPIVDGVNGFVAADAATAAERLRQLLGDRDLALALGRQARQTVIDQFNLTACVAAWEPVFAACIDRWRSRRRAGATSADLAALHAARGGAVAAASVNAASEGSTVRAPRPVPAAQAPARLAAAPSASPSPRRLRVLLAAPANPLSTSAYYERALRRGHDVLTCGPQLDAATLGQWQQWERQHALKPAGAGDDDKLGLLARLTRANDVPLPWGRISAAEVAARLPAGWRPDLVLWVDAGSDFLLTDPGHFGAPTVCLVGDTHTGQRQWRIEYSASFEWTRLMFARQDLPAFAAAGVRRLGWLPAACEPEIHRRFAVPKAYDLVFVGQTLPQWHQDRVRLLERLRQAGFDLRVDSRVLEEMALLFSRARLVFNRSLNGDLNMRVFEALASGSMLLTDRLAPSAGLEELLVDRRHLVLYDDADLEDLARYYLDHEAEREAIAAAGYQEAICHHTYGHRVDALLSDIFGAGTCATCVAGATEAPSVPSGRPGPAAGTSTDAVTADLPGYYRNSRPELAELVPATARRVLEIGCAAGEMGRLLKSQRPGIQVVGIEREEAAAALARQHLDGVIRGDIESLADLPYPVGWFDCLVFGDVLEHLREPEAILRRLLAWLAADGAVVASIPNVRHQSVLLELMVNGRWQYRDEGLLDRTHLRFFTLAEVRALLNAVGLRPDQVHASQSPPWPQLEAFVRATQEVGGDAEALRREAQVIQYLVRAVRVERRERRGPRVSLVIPVYNRAELTEQCLLALAENTGDDPDYEVIVVDNGSTDWTPYLLHAFEGDLQVLRHDDNLGFARACNRGAEAARGDLLLFLNNDTVVRPGWLAALVAAADSDPQVGVVGARLLYPGGERVQHAGLELRHGVPEHAGRNLPWDDPTVTRSRDLDMVTGACMLVRRQLFDELGGFDPEFVNGVEDVDLCLRGRDRGYRVVYCADSIIEHHEGQTEGRFAHAQQNLQLFAARWGHRFGPDGRLRPDEPASGQPAAAWTAPGGWEGPFFVHSSLAHANRELVLALLARGRVDLGLRPWAADPSAADLDGPRFAPLAARSGREPASPPAFHVRHGWPPDFTRPSAGRLVLMQPWEFGRIPREWVEPLAQVDQIWAYTHYVRQCYVDSGIDPERLEIVPLGVDPVQFAPGATPLPLATQRGCRFLFVGGTLYRKGIDVLLDAYTDAFTARDDVCLVIKDMGTRTFYRGQNAGERIRALQADPENPQILYLTDDLAPADMPRLYAACTCLVHPYRGEGFGLPVAEAMACGLPVIVTAGGACDDFCSDDLALRLPSRRVAVRFAVPTVGSAWLLEPDGAALRQAMLGICRDPQAGQMMGQRASAHIRTEFTWDQAAARAEAALQRCLEGPGSAPLASERLGVVLLGETAPGALTACVEAWGTAVRHLHLGDVEPGLGHSLEALRSGFAGELLAIGPAAPPVLPAALQALTEALAADSGAGVAVLDGGGSPGAHSVPSVGRDWQVWRMSALTEVGGFAEGFRTPAALDETARQLTRRGWRVIGLGVARTTPTPPLDPAEVAESAAVAALAEGDRHAAGGDPAAAVSAWRRALAAKPDFVEARLVLASLLQEIGQASEAVAVLADLAALDPESARAVALLGAAQCRAGDLAAAHRSLTRALELAPDDIEVLCDLAVVELRQGQSVPALSRLERAARLALPDAAAVQHIARLRAEAGQVEAAVQQLRDYLERHPGELPVMGALLDLLVAAGRREEGRALAAAILRLNPGHARAAAVVQGSGG